MLKTLRSPFFWLLCAVIVSDSVALVTLLYPSETAQSFARVMMSVHLAGIYFILSVAAERSDL